MLNQHSDLVLIWAQNVGSQGWIHTISFKLKAATHMHSLCVPWLKCNSSCSTSSHISRVKIWQQRFEKKTGRKEKKQADGCERDWRRRRNTEQIQFISSLFNSQGAPWTFYSFLSVTRRKVESDVLLKPACRRGSSVLSSACCCSYELLHLWEHGWKRSYL